MNFNLIITLLVMVFMIVSFVIQKWSYGLTAMTCVVVLTLAGVQIPAHLTTHSAKS